MGPGGMAPAIVARIDADIQTVLKQPDIREKLLAQGAQIVARGPAEFTEFLKLEIDKWGGVARKAGIRID